MAKSMGMNLASGLQGMLKDGHNSYEGVDEAIMRNINAAKELAAIVRTSLGPNGERASEGGGRLGVGGVFCQSKYLANLYIDSLTAVS